MTDSYRRVEFQSLNLSTITDLQAAMEGHGCKMVSYGSIPDEKIFWACLGNSDETQINKVVAKLVIAAGKSPEVDSMVTDGSEGRTGIDYAIFIKESYEAAIASSDVGLANKVAFEKEYATVLKGYGLS